jgi:hypothetical protein
MMNKSIKYLFLAALFAFVTTFMVSGSPELEKAVKEGNIEKVKQELAKEIPTVDCAQDMIYQSIINGHSDIAKLIIENTKEVSNYSYLICIALNEDQKDVANKIEEKWGKEYPKKGTVLKGPSVNEKLKNELEPLLSIFENREASFGEVSSALESAAQGQKKELFENILKKFYKKFKAQDLDLLYCAFTDTALKGNLKAIKFMDKISRDEISSDAVDTGLQYASEKGHFEVVKYICENMYEKISNDPEDAEEGIISGAYDAYCNAIQEHREIANYIKIKCSVIPIEEEYESEEDKEETFNQE